MGAEDAEKGGEFRKSQALIRRRIKKMRQLKIIVGAAVIFLVTATAFGEGFPELPDWWHACNTKVASIYTFDTAPDSIVPGSLMKWMHPPDEWIPSPPPPWATNDSVKNFCECSHDLVHMPNSTHHGRTGSFVGICEGQEGDEADLVLSMDNALDTDNYKMVFVGVDLWTDAADWDSLIRDVTVEAGGGTESDMIRQWEDAQADGWRQLTITLRICPQPSWEKVRIDFNVPVGDSLILDAACIATCCEWGPSVSEETKWGAIKALYR